MAKGRGGFPGMGGMGNMQQLARQAQKMQEDMARVQQEMQERTVEASAGGGVVTVVASCDQKIQSIKIKPEAVDPDDVEMLEDLVLAAVNEALRLAEETSQKEMAKVTGGMGGLF